MSNILEVARNSSALILTAFICLTVAHKVASKVLRTILLAALFAGLFKVLGLFDLILTITGY